MIKRPCVSVVMSSYNGAKCIKRQLDSILAQKNVDVTVYVRDDGSSDNTVEILKEYSKKNPNLLYEAASNVGWQQSFMLALEAAPKADYYAFSDQDDIWFENKLSNAVSYLSQENSGRAVLFHCNKISTWDDLTPLSKQTKRLPRALNRENALTQEYVQGCSSVMNDYARSLVLKNRPKGKVPHDFWCALVCYLFGVILYDDRPFFYHIIYGNNASMEGRLWTGRLSRLKKFFKHGSIYHLPVQELLDGYGDLLLESDKKFMNHLLNYKKNLFDKLCVLFSVKFRRSSLVGTLSLKTSILLNRL